MIEEEISKKFDELLTCSVGLLINFIEWAKNH